MWHGKAITRLSNIDLKAHFCRWCYCNSRHTEKYISLVDEHCGVPRNALPLTLNSCSISVSDVLLGAVGGLNCFVKQSLFHGP